MPGVDPVSLILSSLLGAGAKAIEVYPELKRDGYTKYNEEELKQLQQEKARGQFGLSSGEKADYYHTSIDPALYQLQTQPQFNTNIGQQDLQNQMKSFARAEATGNLNNQAAAGFNDLNHQRVLAQQQELEDRTKYDSDWKKNRNAAIASIASSILGAGAGSFEQQQTANPSLTPQIPGSISATPDSAGIPGLDPELLKAFGSNPELLSALPALLA